MHIYGHVNILHLDGCAGRTDAKAAAPASIATSARCATISLVIIVACTQGSKVYG